jgi:hypothetical protein
LVARIDKGGRPPLAVFFRPYHCISYERQWRGGASLPVSFVTGRPTPSLLLSLFPAGARLKNDQEPDMPKDIDLKSTSKVSAAQHQTTPVAPDSATEHARDAVNMAGVGASFLNDNIHPVVNALVELSKFDGMELAANRVRMALVNDLAKVCRQLVEEAAGHMEGELREMQGKLDLLEGVAA